MNDENCPPNNHHAVDDGDEKNNLSMSSIKAGAAVFGNLLFGNANETPDHSLCYSPSPVINRRRNNNNNNNNNNPILEDEESTSGTVLSFNSNNNSSNSSVEESPLKPKQKAVKKVDPNNRGGLQYQKNTSNNNRNKNSRSAGLPTKKKTWQSSGSSSTSSNNSSVNPVINSVRRSKQENQKEKALSVAELREQRRIEREEVHAFNVQAEQTRREVIDLRKKLNERFRQAKVDRELRQREEKLAGIESEIQFKSQVHVEHKRTLKQQEDNRRRLSTAARAKLRQNHREGKQRMKLLSIQEDQALYEERYESSVAMRNTKADNAEKRRNSFAFRNGDAQRIRELFAQRETDEKYAEHESYELKWQGERDAEDYKKQMDQERRDSLAFRNAEGKSIRDFEEAVKADSQHDEHESYELKWAGERDAEDYKKQIQDERRDSFAFRNADGKRIRDLEEQMKNDTQQDEHESYELKWDGERDAEDYKRQMEEERRGSFAFRNAEGKSIRDLEEQMKNDAQQDEHESYELKWAGERDAEDYKRQMEEERRNSFAFRNAEGKRIRDLEGQMKADDLHDEHESYELKWAGEKDAEEYKKQMAEERRDSFAFRNAEGRSIRDLEEQMKVDAQQDEHESYELKWAGERDAENYKKQMQEERRESFAFRNAEASRHDAVMREILSLAQEREHESYMLKWAGEKDAEEYLSDQEELRRQSLAFRNAEGKRHRDIDEEDRAQQVAEMARDEELKAACKFLSIIDCELVYLLLLDLIFTNSHLYPLLHI